MKFNKINLKLDIIIKRAKEDWEYLSKKVNENQQED